MSYICKAYQLPKEYKLNSINHRLVLSNVNHGDNFDYDFSDLINIVDLKDSLNYLKFFKKNEPTYRFERNYNKSLKECKKNLKGISLAMNTFISKLFNENTIISYVQLTPFFRINAKSGHIIQTFFSCLELSTGVKWFIVVEPISELPYHSDLGFHADPTNKSFFTAEELNIFINTFIHSFDSTARSAILGPDNLYKYKCVREHSIIDGKNILAYSLNYKLDIIIKENFNFDILKSKEQRYITFSVDNFVEKTISNSINYSIFMNLEDCAINLISNGREIKQNDIFYVYLLKGLLLLTVQEEFIKLIKNRQLSIYEKDILIRYSKFLKTCRKEFEITYSVEVQNSLRLLRKKINKETYENLKPFISFLFDMASLILNK